MYIYISPDMPLYKLKPTDVRAAQLHKAIYVYVYI